MRKRGWVANETYAVSIVNPGSAVRVTGPPESLEKLAEALETDETKAEYDEADAKQTDTARCVAREIAEARR